MVQGLNYTFMIYDGGPDNVTIVMRGTLKEGRAYIERIEDMFAQWMAQNDPMPVPDELATWEGGDLVAVDENGRMLEWLDEFKAWTDHEDFKLYDDDLNNVGAWVHGPGGGYVYWGADAAPYGHQRRPTEQLPDGVQSALAFPSNLGQPTAPPVQRQLPEPPDMDHGCAVHPI